MQLRNADSYSPRSELSAITISGRLNSNSQAAEPNNHVKRCPNFRSRQAVGGERKTGLHEVTIAGWLTRWANRKCFSSARAHFKPNMLTREMNKFIMSHYHDLAERCTD